MKDLKGTKTEKNLETAFAGESMARNKYSFYASKAKKDGFEQIAALFEETVSEFDDYIFGSCTESEEDRKARFGD